MVERNGRQEVDHCRLVPDPATAWIIRLLFELAFTQSLGSSRLARKLNENPDVPQELKPFYAATVNYWLSNPIYIGELLWEEHSTGVVDDVRVIERNADADMLRIPDFCEPLVTREVWDAVQALRSRRGEAIRRAHQARRNASEKQIAPMVPGLVLRYLLTGLVRCAHCGRSMIPSGSPEYTTKDGKAKRYVGYVCPGYSAGVCANERRVPEKWLRETIVGLIRERLFPGSEGTQANE
jgi:hypothetical protein